MPKAVKRCPECGSDIHAASKKCYCGYEFYKFQNKKKNGKTTPWWELKKGDYIRIYSNDHWRNPKTDESIIIGNNGKFEVIEVCENGLVLYNKYGCCFQDMISTGKGKSGIIREIPTVVKIRHDKSITRSQN